MHDAVTTIDRRRPGVTLGVAALVLAAFGASPLGAEPLFTGVFTRGTDSYLLWSLADWGDFQGKWRDAGQHGLRLVAVRSFVPGKQRAYVGAWREGGEAEELATELDAAAFQARNRELAAHGLRLVDLVPPCIPTGAGGTARSTVPMKR